MEKKITKSKKKKKKNASSTGNNVFIDEGKFIDSDEESEEEEERPANARKWTVKQVGDFLFENNFARQAFWARMACISEIARVSKKTGCRLPKALTLGFLFQNSSAERLFQPISNSFS